MARRCERCTWIARPLGWACVVCKSLSRQPAHLKRGTSMIRWSHSQWGTHKCAQLAVAAPVFLALTAATPILKGMLVDSDVRWNVISGYDFVLSFVSNELTCRSVDCRTPAELSEPDARCNPNIQPDLAGPPLPPDPLPLCMLTPCPSACSLPPCMLTVLAGDGVKPLPKSRYSSISTYLCNCKSGDRIRNDDQNNHTVLLWG